MIYRPSNLSNLVLITLLKRHLAVIISAFGVTVSPT